MGVSKQQAAENRAAITSAAEALFRERGVDAVGLVELMAAAGMTRGGFYNHFASKDALIEAVLAKAMADGYANLAAAVESSLSRGGDPLADQFAWYLSPEHRDDIDHGCPNAGFAGDARRLDPGTRDRYAQGLATHLATFTEMVREARSTGPDRVPDDSTDPGAHRSQALALVSEMIGALVLSRAVLDSDPVLADEILDSARTDLLGRRAAEIARTQQAADSGEAFTRDTDVRGGCARR
ncbi:TetR/AcrR family transcriptional regulator [Kitasatospora kifunensis]|uniref:TetR/AcrR family transcriptional repressor of nem operon n=1 Tax=Kitasatospora kifunensis TaxID=58351 RepID=A0A7W7VSS6_KITKI|nr:TetR/AcrR family transcriptional regulator [Kitasatospora kifunensis]MBB4921511.1 TetR/AcrR family transcriptional repressor of nem operon [Kitasatospora kifunensis]